MSKPLDLLFRLLVIGVVALCFVVAAYCQDHKHTDFEEWEDSIRVRFIRVTSFDKDLIYYQKLTRFERKLSSFGYNQNTRFPNGFFKDASGCYWVHYCIKHLMLYSLDKVPCKER